MKERLQKILARAGLGSRRDCDRIVAEGRVRVNSQVATVGTQADPETDAITVDGRAIRPPELPMYLALNKPAGVLSTVEDPRGRPTVLDLVPLEGRLYPVGRLDYDSEGLILLTNDGELTHELTHPSFEHEKEYLVLVEGQVEPSTVKRLRSGVELEDGRTAPAKVWVLNRPPAGSPVAPNTTWLRMILHEGRKRQIRRMGQAVRHKVLRIIRVRMGSIELGRLEPGQWRSLTSEEIRQLKSGHPHEQIRSSGHGQRRARVMRHRGHITRRVS